MAVVVSIGGLDVSSSSTSAAESKPLQVTATTTMVADLAREVGGERVVVKGLMGPGVDPHLYKPTASDLFQLRKADVIFYNGLRLEGKMSDLLDRLAKSKPGVAAVTSGISESKLLKPAEWQAMGDPHVWGDPSLWIDCAKQVALTLSEVDPDGKSYYVERLKVVTGELQDLQAWISAQLSKISPEKRLLVTSHDAFNYFGRAFEMDVLGIQGISTVSQAGLADITQVADLVKKRGVRAIFVESSVSKATIERVSADAGVRIGGELYSDALGTPGAKETLAGITYDPGVYIGMMQHNTLTIVTALAESNE
jgi:manganese/zinc/iron transport system substrate-binding protein